MAQERRRAKQVALSFFFFFERGFFVCVCAGGVGCEAEEAFPSFLTLL